MIKIFAIILPLLASTSLYSQNLHDAVDSTMKANNSLPSGVIDVSCTQCVGTTEVKSEDEIFCSNLFVGSCLNSDGSRNESNSQEMEKEKLKQKVRQAQDQVAITLGHKDHNEALYNELQKIGFELPESLTENNYKKLKKDFKNGEYGEDIKFPDFERCEKINVQSVGLTELSESNKEVALKRMAIIRKAKLDYAYLDIPNFLSSEFERCNVLKDTTKYPLSLNQELSDKCKKFPIIRERAVDIYRMEDSPEYKKLAQDFIRDNLLPMAQLAKENGEIDDSNPAYISCYDLSTFYNNLATKAVENYERKINRSRQVVQSMVTTYYSAGTKVELENQFEMARSEVVKLLPKITKDTSKIKKITKEYGAMELAWLTLPGNDRFTKDTSGLEVLKVVSSEDGDDLDYAFGNSKLSFFTEINAFYNSFVMEGDKRVKNDIVTMQPFFLQYVKTNKFNFMATIAHEIGHKIGPEVSKENGHDLRSDWSKLLDCYRKSDSIKMVNKQRDEVIADYISSEVLVSMFSKLPISERKNAFKMAMKDLCLFNDCDNVDREQGFHDTHPENIFRINGILGANPKLRQVIGCPAENPKYRSCSL